MSPRTKVPTRAAILVASVGALMLAVVGSAPRAGANPTWTGRIAFDHIVDNGPEDIITIAPDGSDAQQVTHTPAGQGGSEAPEWTPGGEGLLFDSDRAGQIHAFSTTLDGSVRQLTNGDGFEFTPAISADGNQFAYEHDSADFTSGGIFVSARRGDSLAAGTQITDAPGLAKGGFDTDPEFSPDGSKIVFERAFSTTRPTARSTLVVIDIDGRGPCPPTRPCKLTPPKLNAMYPRWSPDGTRIAFSSNSDNFSDTLPANVYVINADGTGMKQVTHRRDGAHAFTPDWSPDGTRLVYATAAPGQPGTNLEVMDLKTGATTVIWHGELGTQDQDPVWSRR